MCLRIQNVASCLYTFPPPTVLGNQSVVTYCQTNRQLRQGDPQEGLIWMMRRCPCLLISSAVQATEERKEANEMTRIIMACHLYLFTGCWISARGGLASKKVNYIKRYKNVRKTPSARFLFSFHSFSCCPFVMSGWPQLTKWRITATRRRGTNPWVCQPTPDVTTEQIPWTCGE